MTLTLPHSDLIKKMLLVFLIAGFFLFFVPSVFAQDASQSAENIRKYKITFPIAELGNCADFASCRAFCSDEANQEACLEYARKKGFANKRKAANAITASIIAKARAELGCSSQAECKEVCQLEENREKCTIFAKANKLAGGLKDGSESGKMRGPRNASGSGEKFTPASERAYERANENARFCREYPEKCLNATASGELKREQKELERLERLESKLNKRGVQGATSSSTFLENLFKRIFQ